MTAAGATAGGRAVASDGPGAGIEYPRLLYMCELPPSNLNGGPILMRRLLAEYPQERLTVACAPSFMHLGAATLLPCEHVTLLRTNGRGRLGWGRVKQLFDLLVLPQVQRATERMIRAKRIDAVLTVAHDCFFLAAVRAARNAGVPCIVVVHDDWITLIGAHTWLPRALAPVLFRKALQGASRVYAVSEGVQEWLAKDFGVASEVQLPATEPHEGVCTRPRREPPFRIGFAGTGTESVIAGIDVLVKGLTGQLAKQAWRLDMYGVSEEQVRQQGWADERIRAHGWGTQEQIRALLRDSDLVYLPLGFDPRTRLLAVRSFSSKLTDYLAAGRATLVCAPPECSISRYVRRHGCAELVEEPSPQRLAEAVRSLMENPERREGTAARGLEVFRENHDIRKQRKEFIADLQQLIAAGAERRSAKRWATEGAKA